MKRSKFDESRDQRVADEYAVPRSLMCHAHGCPNRCTVSFGGPGLCSAHAWAEPERWPEITEQQQWDETERARLRVEPRPHVEPLTRADKAAIIARMRQMLARFGQPKNPREWAEKLRDREQSGKRLGETQRTMWRAALGVDAASAWNPGGTIPEPKFEEEWAP